MSIEQRIINYINKRQRADHDAGKPGSYQVYAINWAALFAILALILSIIGMLMAIPW